MTERRRFAIAWGAIFRGRHVQPPRPVRRSLGPHPAPAAGSTGRARGVGDDTRLFVNVIRYLAKTGIPWADLPTAVGKSNSLWQRSNRWCERGVWERIAAELRDDDTEWLLVHSSCVRAHPCAAGAKKKRTGRAGNRPRRWAAGAVGSAPRSTRP